jgi:PAS domain S-box-containing protein
MSTTPPPELPTTAAELERSRTHLALALEAGGMGTWEWDVVSGRVRWSPEQERLYGLEPGAFGGTLEAYRARVHPDDLAEAWRPVEAALAGRAERFHVRHRVVRPGGDVRWLESRGRFACDAAGRPLRLLGVSTDVTEPPRAEPTRFDGVTGDVTATERAGDERRVSEPRFRAGEGAGPGASLRAREEEFRTLANAIPQLVWTARPDGYHDFFNDRWYDYTGMPRGYENGWDWKHFLHPDDHPRAAATWARSLETGEPYSIEYRFRDAATGAYRWFIGRALPQRGPSGAVVRWFGTCTDIEEQKRAEAERDRALAEARHERSRLAELLEQAPAAISVSEGPEHVTVSQNAMSRRLIGGRSVVGMRVVDVVPDAAEQGYLALLDRVYATGEPFAGDEMPVRFDFDGDGAAEERYFNIVYQPVRGPDGRVRGILTHSVDVTAQVLARREVERKAAELAALSGALERSNRELDQFAYVASHDLKAPLRGIANLAQWIEEDLGDRVAGESREHMRLLKGRVHRMGALIDGILAYSRAGRVRVTPERVDLGAAAREAAELVAPPAGARVEVADDLPPVVAERVPLQQVLLNLVGNAVKFASAHRADAVVRVGWRDAGECVELRVSDNGPGIAPEFHDRIWGIFQTLQARDRVEGTGIGLSVVKKIVEARGGRAWVESEPGAGATFVVTVPKVARREAAEPPAA